jgi:hypothetical protein
MSEFYPDDASLLAMAQDSHSGVEMIPTGQSPYVLAFRRLMQRLLLATGRAGDLRVYQDGDLSVGVRPGRCRVQGASLDFVGCTEIAIAPSAVTHLWLDGGGNVQSATDGLPADRSTGLPLAQVAADAIHITALIDLRGETFLHVPTFIDLGVGVTQAKLEQALGDIDATVTSAAFNRLTGGPTALGDADHQHSRYLQDVDGPASFVITNENAGGNANAALVFSLTNALPDDTLLQPSRAHGFLEQRYDGLTYTIPGVTHAQYRRRGDLTTSLTGELVGVVPITGVVSNVILSLGVNLQSSVGGDSVTATVKVNGTTLTSTPPAITSAAGAGFRSTARGAGMAAVVKSDGTQNVQCGDVLTVDLTRSVGGNVSTEAADVVVLVVVRPARPE